MDVLSDVIGAFRTGRPFAKRETQHGRWTISYDTFDGVGFHVVLEGDCRLDVPGEPTLRLSAGDVVLTPHGAPHRLSDFGQDGVDRASLLCGAYRLDQSVSHPLLAELPQMIRLTTSVGRDPALRTAIAMLGAELQEPQTGSDAAIPSLLDLLLVYSLRAWIGDAPTGPWSAALADPVVSTALRLMHDDPVYPWTVEKMGHHAGLSRAAFARRFTRVVGMPPLAYLTRWRLTLAARQLRHSDLPLTAIAPRVGYTSPFAFAFANAFKRELGLPPGVYRQRHTVHDATEW